MKIQNVNPWDINEGDIYDLVFINYSKTQTVATNSIKSLSKEQVEQFKLGDSYFSYTKQQPKKKIIKRIV
jgi:hypothetical protein